MFGVLLPVYELTPRDLASVQWRPVRVRTENGFAVVTTASVFVDTPHDECWLLDSILIATRGAAAIIGPPAFNASSVVDTTLAFNDPALVGFPGARIINIDRFLVTTPTSNTFTFRKNGGQLFVPPNTRILAIAAFDVENPNGIINMSLNGIAFPRGNMAQ